MKRPNEIELVCYRWRTKPRGIGTKCVLICWGHNQIEISIRQGRDSQCGFVLKENPLMRSSFVFFWLLLLSAQIRAEAAYLYDAVMRYADALGQILLEGGDPYDGVAIMERIRKRSYNSAMGYVSCTVDLLVFSQATLSRPLLWPVHFQFECKRALTGRLCFKSESPASVATPRTSVDACSCPYLRWNEINQRTTLKWFLDQYKSSSNISVHSRRITLDIIHVDDRNHFSQPRGCLLKKILVHPTKKSEKI